MRLFEFDMQLVARVKAQLIALRDLSDSKEINTKAVINMLRKDHIPISYDGLKRLYDENTELQNFIKNMDQAKIKLKDEEVPKPEATPDTEEPEEQDDEKDNIEDKVKAMADKGAKGSDRVAKMASSAAKRRA